MDGRTHLSTRARGRIKRSQSLGNKKLQIDPTTRKTLIDVLAQSNPDTEEPNLKEVVVLALLIEPIGNVTDSNSSTNLQPPSVAVPSFHLLEPGISLTQALSGSVIVEWPVIEVWPSAAWAKQVASGRVQIVPKSTIATRPTDPGWANKRKKIGIYSVKQNSSELEQSGVGGGTGTSQGPHPDALAGPLVDYSSACED
ncbi:hypothetical protein CROQUDRAFT_276606 [Cronartium quercuum f. sp. fusiforme G11]|uniref:Uncharacterized protein n=1 Tax=Cronartium quercuum f. sp. fusiforme G11 TaxID=708437 RepID=A0A9P6NMI0_9BASI|nr:hypothetical protein CROQUDRAFT_276606 [Cronartium quercuum f. sp. fusiforme G11]